MFTPIVDYYSISAQLHPEDLRHAASAGFKSVINHRPDHEGGPEQPTSELMQSSAESQGLVYAYLPINGANIQLEDVQEMAHLLHTLPRPILAFCRSGARSTKMFDLARQLDETLL